tara:strand:- start:5869 stop:7539 length:1671 start_codon:yes stop_codon:yes gene_type:complete
MYSEAEAHTQQFALERGVDLEIRAMSHQEFRFEADHDEAQFAEYDLVLVNADISRVARAAVDLAYSSSTVDRLIELAPESDVRYVLPETPGPVSQALTQVMSLFSIDARFVTERVNPERFLTVMHLLDEKVTGRMQGPSRLIAALQHDYKNRLWEQYVPFIDTALRAGNSQTAMYYQFIILSDRQRSLLGEYSVEAQEKVQVQSSDYVLQEQDLVNTAAIFIDNAWNEMSNGSCLGEGIETLRRVRTELNECGVDIPIIYQSGHKLEDFTPEEQAEIARLGAVLSTKDVFPKVYEGKEKADKELEIGRILSTQELSSHLALVDRVVNASDDRFVACSRIVTEQRDDDRKDELFASLGIESNSINHRMYVLALLHSSMKDEVDNPILSEPTVQYLRPFSQVVDGLPAGSFVDFSTEKLYEGIRVAHEVEKPTTIIHNDSKWDNWFNGTTLGDFGDSCAGTEYKDLARALLDAESNFALVQDVNYVEKAISNYLALRSELDQFESADFARKVKELIFVESLRLARYKNAVGGSSDVVQGLLSVAETYQHFLIDYALAA